MTEYLPSFIIEPVLRQARRFSRLSGTEESPGFLPAVPESIRTWTPSRFWSTSPPPSITEDEHHQESTLQQIARNIQLWTNQIPSPPLEPMEDSRREEVVPASNNVSVSEFPALDPQYGQQPRPVRLEETRQDSETSLNPLRELPDRSRLFEDGARGHSQSDPTSGTGSRGQTISNIAAQPLQEADHDQYRRRDGSGALPEDDGMGPLRQRINAVWGGDGTPAEKSRLIHTLMMERYRLTQARAALTSTSRSKPKPPDRSHSPMSIISGASQEAVFNLSSADLTPSFVPDDPDAVQADDEDGHPIKTKPELGCVHYKRNVKMQCTECERWYPCRLCHDEVENHVLPRRQTKHMLCMLCNTPQSVSQTCKMCLHLAASYYCSVCKLWSDDASKSIYHCDDCGICRLGEGLGKDFFHCKKCAACMSIQAEETHKCLERSTQCDCPICGEYLFTSAKSVAFMKCGHSIHETCFADWCNSSYKCPICSKSITNMESQFRRLDRHIAEQPMPEEYSETRAYIFCNDCSSRSTTQFHWLGLRCERCESYNTAQLQLLGPDDVPQVQEREADSAIVDGRPTSGTASNPHTPVQSVDDVRRPSLAELRLLTRSPGARSMSPIVGSYFGSQRRQEPPRQTTPVGDDEDLDFWGGRSPTSPRSQQDIEVDDESEELSSSSDEVMEHEDGEEDEDDDELDLFGHR